MATLPFQCKICGVTTPDDGRSAAAAGADAIGLNFYPGSPRYIEVLQARQIVAPLPPGLKRVGVFVNASAADIKRVADELPLDLIQLHGDEPPELLSELRDYVVVRALRCQDGLTQAISYLAACDRLDCRPAMVLIDAAQPGQYGGTGITADWTTLARDRHLLGDTPLVLAGGLKPDNVASAIASVRPDAVDTASGVEIGPGRKSPELVAAFVRAARAAFADLERHES